MCCIARIFALCTHENASWLNPLGHVIVHPAVESEGDGVAYSFTHVCPQYTHMHIHTYHTHHKHSRWQVPTAWCRPLESLEGQQLGSHGISALADMARMPHVGVNPLALASSSAAPLGVSVE